METSAPPLAPNLDRWLETAPTAAAQPEHAAEALSRHLLDAESLLAQLPARPARDARQQALADAIHRHGRQARAAFMRGHASWVYDTLTHQRSAHLRLDELAHAASIRFPGLVPTREQIAAERQFAQRDKEGREIDQGIFFSALLSEPRSGTHLIHSMLAPGGSARALLDEFGQVGRVRLDTLLIERKGTTAQLTVHNEACLNAEDDQLIADMETGIDLVLLDADSKVGVLRGSTMTHPKYAGRRVFSAGINLRLLQRGQISYVDFLLRREMGYISKILRGLRLDSDACAIGDTQVEKPWIAAVDSFAIGGGAQLLLVFDRVIASSGSFFSLPAAQEGIVPGVANLRLTRAVGSRTARQIILGGRRIWADEPEGAKLFDQVAEAHEMEAAIAASAAQLASPAVLANRRMLTVAEEPLEHFRLYMAQFALEQAHRLYSPDVLDKIER